MTQNVENPAALGDRASRDALLLAGFEHSETTPNPDPSQRQTEARELETLARGHALAAVCLGGALALQHVALSAHYARRAVCKMIGGRR
jgi:hypothetical protein